MTHVELMFFTVGNSHLLQILNLIGTFTFYSHYLFKKYLAYLKRPWDCNSLSNIHAEVEILKCEEPKEFKNVLQGEKKSWNFSTHVAY